jgi:glycosyltransferase involved in cell wall biosynthesis
MPGPSVYVIAPGGSRARGGIGRSVANLERKWAARTRAFELSVIDDYGVSGRLLMPFYFVGALLRTLAGCLTRRVALVHVHMAANGSVLRKGLIVYAAKLFGTPVLLHLHGGDLAIFYRAIGPRLRRAVAHMVARADGVIVLGGFWRGFAVDELGIAPRVIDVLPNGMADPGRPARGSNHGECRMLFLGDVCENKGVSDLLAALADPRLRRANWTLRIAGKGQTQNYEALARRLGIAERVFFLGWVVPESVTRDLLTTAEVLVLPSHFEGLPMAVIEAMAYGLAIVATSVGAVTDAVSHDETALLVPVGDIPRLADALLRLIEDVPLRRRLTQAARRRFLRQFEITAIVHRLETIYTKYARAAPAVLPIGSRRGARGSG